MVSTRGVIRWTRLCLLFGVFLYDGACGKEKPSLHRQKRNWLENLIGNALTSLNNGTDSKTDISSLTTVRPSITSSTAVSQSFGGNHLQLLNVTSTAGSHPNASRLGSNDNVTQGLNIDSLLGNFLQDLIKNPADGSDTSIGTSPLPNASPATLSTPSLTTAEAPIDFSDILGQLISGLQNESPLQNGGFSSTDQSITTISTAPFKTTEYQPTKQSVPTTGLDNINFNISSILGGLVKKLKSSDNISTTGSNQPVLATTASGASGSFDLKSILEGFANGLKTTPSTIVNPTTSDKLTPNMYTTATLKTPGLAPPAGSPLQEAGGAINIPTNTQASDTTNQSSFDIPTTTGSNILQNNDIFNILGKLLNSSENIKESTKAPELPITSQNDILKGNILNNLLGTLLSINDTKQSSSIVSATTSAVPPSSTVQAPTLSPPKGQSSFDIPTTTSSNILQNNDIFNILGKLLNSSENIKESTKAPELPLTSQNDILKGNILNNLLGTLLSINDTKLSSSTVSATTSAVPTSSTVQATTLSPPTGQSSFDIPTTTSSNILQNNDIFNILGKLLNSSENVAGNIKESSKAPELPLTSPNDILKGNILNNLLGTLLSLNDTKSSSSTVSATTSAVPPSSTVQATTTSVKTQTTINDNYFNDILKGILDSAYGGNTTTVQTAVASTSEFTNIATTTASVLSGNDLAGILGQILNDIGSSGTEINYTESTNFINKTTDPSNGSFYTTTKRTTASPFGQIDFDKIFGNIFSNLTKENSNRTSTLSQSQSTRSLSIDDQGFQSTDPSNGGLYTTLRTTPTTASPFGQIDFDKIFGNLFSNTTTENSNSTSTLSQSPSTRSPTIVDESFQSTTVASQQSITQSRINSQPTTFNLNATSINTSTSPTSVSSTLGTSEPTTPPVPTAQSSASTPVIILPTADVLSTQPSTQKVLTSIKTSSLTVTTAQPNSTDSVLLLLSTLPSAAMKTLTTTLPSLPTYTESKFLSTLLSSQLTSTNTAAPIAMTSRKVTRSSSVTSSLATAGTPSVPSRSITTSYEPVPSPEPTSRTTGKPFTVSSMSPQVTSTKVNIVNQTSRLSSEVTTSSVTDILPPAISDHPTNRFSKFSTLSTTRVSEKPTKNSDAKRSTTFTKSATLVDTTALPKSTIATKTVTSTLSSTTMSSSVSTIRASTQAASAGNQEVPQTADKTRLPVDQPGSSVRQESVKDVKSGARTILAWGYLSLNIMLMLTTIICFK